VCSRRGAIQIHVYLYLYLTKDLASLGSAISSQRGARLIFRRQGILCSLEITRWAFPENKPH